MKLSTYAKPETQKNAKQQLASANDVTQLTSATLLFSVLINGESSLLGDSTNPLILNITHSPYNQYLQGLLSFNEDKWAMSDDNKAYRFKLIEEINDLIFDEDQDEEKLHVQGKDALTEVEWAKGSTWAEWQRFFNAFVNTLLADKLDKAEQKKAHSKTVSGKIEKRNKKIETLSKKLKPVKEDDQQILIDSISQLESKDYQQLVKLFNTAKGRRSDKGIEPINVIEKDLQEVNERLKAEKANLKEQTDHVVRAKQKVATVTEKLENEKNGNNVLEVIESLTNDLEQAELLYSSKLRKLNKMKKGVILEIRAEQAYIKERITDHPEFDESNKPETIKEIEQQEQQEQQEPEPELALAS